jgi:hypothetical protein
MDTIYQEWLNQNSYRAYPLREDTSQVSTDGTETLLPTYLFVDFILTVPGDASFSAHIGELAFVGGFLTCLFVDADGTTICTLTVNTNVHTRYQAYELTGQGAYEDARGKAVLGDLTQLRNDIPDGVYTFTDTMLETTTIRPTIRGVRSIQTASGDMLSERIFGHIKLIEGTNIRLTYLPDQNGIRIDAINGVGFNEVCECDEQYQLPDCVRRINGINAEDVQIIGDGKCVNVSVSGNTITIEDTCSAPCCGCPELEFITTHLDLLQSTLRRVEEYADVLRNRTLEMITSMLAATRGG